MVDADTIHAVAEKLYEGAVEHKGVLAAKFHTYLDQESGSAMASMLFPLKSFPADLIPKIDDSVVRNVAAYLKDLDLTVKFGDDPEFGKSFVVHLPARPVRLSWDQVMEKLGLPPSGDAKLP